MKTVDRRTDHWQTAASDWVNELIRERGLADSVDTIDRDANWMRAHDPSDSFRQHLEQSGTFHAHL
jgi:hypothetical protein